MECLDEVLEFLKGREAFVNDQRAPIEEAARACCSESKPVWASARVGNSVTPAIRFVVEDSSYRHLLLDALAVVKEWMDRAGIAGGIYFALASDFAEVRVLESCVNACSEDVAKSLASAILAGVESKLRKLFIATGSKMKAINLVAVEGPSARIPAPRCGAKYFPPKDLDRFLDPSEVEHNPSWRSVGCEGIEELVKRASRTRIIDRVEAPPRAAVPKTFGRFEVMALLQAARYYLLTGDLDKAKSFGLNRAIFYAWAKYYGPRGRAWIAYRASSGGKGLSKGVEKAEPLEDEVPKSPRGWFEMDGKEQLPQDFDRQVGTKIEAAIPMAIAWRRALAYVRRFPLEVLRDPNKFFKYVYEPVRDSFIEKVVANPLHSIEVHRIEHRVVAKKGRELEGAKPPVRTLTEFARERREKNGSK